MYILTYILSLLDLFFTLYEAKIFGADIELNPFGKVLITNIPFEMFYKAVIVGFCLYLLWNFRERKSALWSARILFGLYGLLNLYHLSLTGQNWSAEFGHYATCFDSSTLAKQPSYVDTVITSSNIDIVKITVDTRKIGASAGTQAIDHLPFIAYLNIP